jgi:hypothetical protein
LQHSPFGTTVSLGAAAKNSGFRDDFTTFDTSRWLVSSRPFGHGAVDPANVGVANGELGIRLPGDKLDGGEVRTRSLYKFGTYRARIRVANAPSSLTAFFLTSTSTPSSTSPARFGSSSTGLSCRRGRPARRSPR